MIIIKKTFNSFSHKYSSVINSEGAIPPWIMKTPHSLPRKVSGFVFIKSLKCKTTLGIAFLMSPTRAAEPPPEETSKFNTDIAYFKLCWQEEIFKNRETFIIAFVLHISSPINNINLTLQIQ